MRSHAEFCALYRDSIKSGSIATHLAMNTLRPFGQCTWRPALLPVRTPTPPLPKHPCGEAAVSLRRSSGGRCQRSLFHSLLCLRSRSLFLPPLLAAFVAEAFFFPRPPALEQQLFWLSCEVCLTRLVLLNGTCELINFIGVGATMSPPTASHASWNLGLCLKSSCIFSMRRGHASIGAWNKHPQQLA